MADINQQKRQEIYDRIRESSREEFILSEMKRLGFWDVSEEKPQLAENFIKERSGLRNQLHELLKEKRLLENKDALLQQIHKERMKRSKEQQLINKKKRLAEREAKRRAWEERKQADILYLGKGVSSLLNKQASDNDALQRNKLPVISNAKELADLMGISTSKLRFLCYTREVSEICHYKRFAIAKKTGGERIISAPMPSLKSAQRWVLENILNQCEVSSYAHGFVASRTIVSNAALHCGQSTVINLDMQNFFPTITYKRVLGMFRSLGFSPQLASIFSLLCTEPATDEIELDGKKYYVQCGDRHLPQGSPASPAITNIICRRLDKRLSGLVKRSNAVYSRYADDITISFSGKDPKTVKCLLKSARKIAESEGFYLNNKKTRVMHANKRQEVTGIVVNKFQNIKRAEVKKLKAVLFQVEKDGLDGKNWKGKTGIDMLRAMKGYADYTAMVRPEKYTDLQIRSSALLKKYAAAPKTASKWNDEKNDTFMNRVMKLFGKKLNR